MKGFLTHRLPSCCWLLTPLLRPPSPLFVVMVFVVLDGSRAAAAWANAGERDKIESFTTRSRTQLVKELQTNCHTPVDVLHRVGRHVTPSIDPDGSLSRLVLVRLAKQWMTIDNHHRQSQQERRLTTELRPFSKMDEEMSEENKRTLSSVIASLTEANIKSSSSTINEACCDNLIEGTKALSVLLRCLRNSNVITSNEKMEEVLENFWSQNDSKLSSFLAPHQLSGLDWAMSNFCVLQQNGPKASLSNNSSLLPPKIRAAYDELNLPFRILPGFVSKMHHFSLQDLVQQVDFSVDDIRTTSNQVVKERRQTAWQGDDGVAPFSYSSKAMPRQPWSPTVHMVRDALSQELNQYYDGCLLNLYHDGGSGMRYHIDPDQGTLWDYETAVVSIGASRRFAFREITPSTTTAQVSTSVLSDTKKRRAKSSNNNNNDNNKSQTSSPIVHSFVVMHGDVALMYNDCQQRFQHTVKKSEDRNDMTARASLVFKRTLKR